MAINVQAEPTPNPNAMKFTADRNLFEKSTSLKKGDDTEHELAQALLELDGVDNIFGVNDFVTVNKTMDADWDDLTPKVEQVFAEAE
ncbi:MULTISPECIES: NifU N-terminal domain-containing protein [Salibacterium]|uniref:Scaffold protein Nfu/NifU N terminal n=2 Tax=Salibacterium TaxID=1884429 RepID=A0A1I4HUL0_9BACI|nr:NifU N-terminal domain-containing protein [Salibacterium qingdaonense]SFL45500.1 Scaffold protein Nfu/NifU N terminal [Salibacterium qingdaonense]